MVTPKNCGPVCGLGNAPHPTQLLSALAPVNGATLFRKTFAAAGIENWFALTDSLPMYVQVTEIPKCGIRPVISTNALGTAAVLPFQAVVPVPSKTDELVVLGVVVLLMTLFCDGAVP